MGVGRAHAVDAQDLARVAVATQLLEEDALLVVGGLHDHGGYTVPEKHGDVAVVPVHEGGDPLAADDECRLDGAGADHGGGHGERIEEARAGGVEVHRAATVGADAALQARGLVGALVVVGRGAHDDEVEVLGADARAGQRAAGGHLAHVAERDLGDPALADARARGDPVVGRVEERRDVRVRENCWRQALAPTRDARIRHALSPLHSCLGADFEGERGYSLPKGVTTSGAAPVAGMAGAKLLTIQVSDFPRKGRYRRYSFVRCFWFPLTVVDAIRGRLAATGTFHELLHHSQKQSDACDAGRAALKTAKLAFQRREVVGGLPSQTMTVVSALMNGGNGVGHHFSQFSLRKLDQG